jgi:tRNA (adenine22-N1)-methyltransferase
LKLDDRLRAVLSFVPVCHCAADIGTDHAHLALSLLASGKAAQVIASDLNQGPCDMARRTIAAAGRETEIEVRQGDGLQVLSPGEAEVICIAGMGGILMKRMLETSPAVWKGAAALVLQPQGGVAELRRYLYLAGWHLADECLVLSEGRLYTVLRAAPGKRELPDDLLLEIGPILWEKQPPLLHQHIEALLCSLQRAAEGMEKSAQARESSRYREIKARIQGLEAHFA